MKYNEATKLIKGLSKKYSIDNKSVFKIIYKSKPIAWVEIYEQLFNEMMAKDGLKVSKSVKIGLMMANRFKKAKDNLIYAGTISDNLDTKRVEDCLGMENEWKLNAIDFAKLEKNLGFRLIEDEQYYRDLMIQKYGDIDRVRGLKELRVLLLTTYVKDTYRMLKSGYSTPIIESITGGMNTVSGIYLKPEIAF